MNCGVMEGEEGEIEEKVREVLKTKIFEIEEKFGNQPQDFLNRRGS
jgi:hypothetical protein